MLAPSKQKIFKKRLFGFDIETTDKNRKFYMASLYSERPIQDWNYINYKVFYKKQELIKELKTKKFQNSLIASTNLAFDFEGTFFNEPESAFFRTLFRGSELLSAYSFIEGENFTLEPKLTKRMKIAFVDTLNYAHLSVEKLGKIINIEKMEKPDFIGRKPKNRMEFEQMQKYNVRDSEISCKAVRFLYNAFESMGATAKMTIASTSMSLFRNKYLKDSYFQPSDNILAEQLKSYYGGRCEAVGRGNIENYYYYDFNSLYPSVMYDFSYPHPNTMRVTKKPDVGLIMQFEGISDITVDCPYMEYPLLPFRYNNKLLFPVGTFRGCYTHAEIRKAVELGYTIKEVHRIIYYKDVCTPFREFVGNLYEKRKDYKNASNPMEYAIKILLNSLYGKFGQKFIERDNFVHKDSISLKEIQNLKFIEQIGDYFRIKKTQRPANFCFPIWASYITSYARMRLYDMIRFSNAVYYDTDSIITTKKIPDSDLLGKLKLEMAIKEGIIIKPKFYAFKSDIGEFVKIKGLNQRLSYKEFEKFLLSPKVFYKKFAKFREALRRDFLPNQIIDSHKEFTLEDDKRIWKNNFNGEFQLSLPFDACSITPKTIDRERVRLMPSLSLYS